MLTPSEREWFHARLLHLAAGLLESDDLQRMERCADQDVACRRAAIAFGADEVDDDAVHVPASLLARWPAVLEFVGGFERRLLERHVAHCSDCRADLALVENLPASAPRSRTVRHGEVPRRSSAASTPVPARRRMSTAWAAAAGAAAALSLVSYVSWMRGHDAVSPMVAASSPALPRGTQDFRVVANVASSEMQGRRIELPPQESAVGLRLVEALPPAPAGVPVELVPVTVAIRRPEGTLSVRRTFSYAELQRGGIVSLGDRDERVRPGKYLVVIDVEDAESSTWEVSVTRRDDGPRWW